ncbi:MAG: phage tail tube protein [Gemmobacter sp.]
MPLFWNRKVILAKIETSYGTDAAPTGADNAVLALNITLAPMEGEDVARGLERPTLGADATIPAGLHAKLSFEVETAPSGTAGTAPAWGPLLRACAVAQVVSAGVSVAYNPISTAHESATLHFFVDGTRYALTGARGTAKLMFAASAVPKFMFEMTGLFTQPVAVANPTPTLTAWMDPQIVSDATTPTCSFNAVDLVMRSLEFDLGNQIAPRFLVNSESILIPQRSEKIAAVVEAVPLATLNPYALAAAQTTAALSLVHGTGAGRITTLAVPRAQIQRPQGLSNQDGLVEWPLSFVPLPGTAGNDQWTLTLT